MHSPRPLRGVVTIASGLLDALLLPTSETTRALSSYTPLLMLNGKYDNEYPPLLAEQSLDIYKKHFDMNATCSHAELHFMEKRGEMISTQVCFFNYYSN